MRKHRSSIFLVIGIVLFVLGISGYQGYEAPGSDVGPYSLQSGHGAYFPGDARLEMAIGAGFIAMGIIGYRNKKGNI